MWLETNFDITVEDGEVLPENLRLRALPYRLRPPQASVHHGCRFVVRPLRGHLQVR